MKEAADVSTCTLCCEEKEASETCVLLGCYHRSCKECMVKWIEKEEASGRTTPPTCPFCRLMLSDEDALAILGRPFQPQCSSNLPDEAEVDELTMQWLNGQTRQCRRCGARIEKIDDDSCDMMECLCGYRFCYRCGSQDAACLCTPAYHHFWDNVLDQFGGDRSTPTQEAVLDADTGLIDLHGHIAHRKKEHLAEIVRIERAERRRQEELERGETHDLSAKWLFLSIRQGYAMLAQDQVRWERGCKRKENEEEKWILDSLNAKMLFRTVDASTWLSCTKKIEAEMQMREGWRHHRQRERHRKENERICLDGVNSKLLFRTNNALRWLHLTHKAENEMSRRSIVRNRRARQRQIEDHERKMSKNVGAKLLFQTNDVPKWLWAIKSIQTREKVEFLFLSSFAEG